MNDHDLTPDLEALLADAATGGLGPEDAERLRAAIAERPWLADLMEEQRTIAGHLDPGPATGLTDLERARLRRSVLDEVAGVDPGPVRAPSRPRPWARWALAAAAAVVVVVVASVGLLSVRLGDDFAPIGQEITSLPTESDDRFAGDEDATSEAAVPEADLGGGDEEGDAGDGADTTDTAGESALAIPSCATPGRSVDALVGRTFDTADEARSAAESTDPTAFSGEADPIERPDRITWVWANAAGSVTGILDVVAEGDGWRVERAEACG